jgi:predicted metal-dependent HD superfamily phosphohydrolase
VSAAEPTGGAETPLVVPGADPTAVARLQAELLDRWSEPQRHYHTVDHLTAMLAVVDAHADLAADPAVVRLAVWFHDAVYQPRPAVVGGARGLSPARQQSNEEASADLAAARLGALGFDATEVVRLVLLTAGHEPAADDADGLLLCDADLAILATEPDVYDRYAAAIRREYAFVPEDAYRAGRGAILAGLHDRPDLYRILPQRDGWTSRARANLVRELATLSP